jgi:hypothetical protein
MYAEHMKAARHHMREAISAREDIYQGQREARQMAQQRGTTPLIEVQRWMSSVDCKMLISNNQWHMQQSIMFSNMAQMELAYVNNNLLKALMEEVARRG